MAIEIGKRHRIKTEIDDFKTKRRMNANQETPSQIIEFGSQSINENIIRLYSLFPNKGREELMFALNSNYNNIEQTISYLQAKDRDNAMEVSTINFAKNLVQDLKSITSIEDAQSLVEAYMKRHTNQITQISSSTLNNENKEIKYKVGGLSTDIGVLKKVVLKLHSKLIEKRDVEEEHQNLVEQIMQEKCKNFSLRAQLNQIADSEDFSF